MNVSSKDDVAKRRSNAGALPAKRQSGNKARTEVAKPCTARSLHGDTAFRAELRSPAPKSGPVAPMRRFSADSFSIIVADIVLLWWGFSDLCSA